MTQNTEQEISLETVIAALLRRGSSDPLETIITPLEIALAEQNIIEQKFSNDPSGIKVTAIDRWEVKKRETLAALEKDFKKTHPSLDDYEIKRLAENTYKLSKVQY